MPAKKPPRKIVKMAPKKPPKKIQKRSKSEGKKKVPEFQKLALGLAKALGWDIDIYSALACIDQPDDDRTLRFRSEAAPSFSFSLLIGLLEELGWGVTMSSFHGHKKGRYCAIVVKEIETPSGIDVILGEGVHEDRFYFALVKAAVSGLNQEKKLLKKFPRCASPSAA